MNAMKALDVDTPAAAAAASAAAAPSNAARAPAPAPANVTVAYLINSYPMTTLSFIRREIVALEAMGVTVHRFAVRRWDQPLVDSRDKDEVARTRIILGQGALPLTLAVVTTAVTRPIAFVRALAAAVRLGRAAGRGVAAHLAYLAEACLLLRWLRDCGAPHVHVHFATNSTTVAMLCRMLGGPPYSFTCHGPEEFDKPVAIALREKIERSAFVVGISDFGCSQLLRWARFEDWPKVKQVRCGVDELFLRVAATPPPDVPRVVNVGRIGRAKGQYLLVQAVARLVAEGHSDIECVLVGDGFNRVHVQKLIDDLKLNGNVRITGWMSNDDVRREILASRAVAMPSFAEGLPLVVMESLALHRPVLSTYVAGIPELVKDGECGWLVPAGSLDALTEALRKVLSTPVSELERMGRTGAALVAERHNVDTEAAKMAALFREHVGS
jgi:glycosyltransferase involved in cell wall biosynthesis